MEEEKRTYAINQIAWLKAKGFKEARMGIDEENGAVYYVFPNSKAIAREVIRYKHNTELRKFLFAFNQVRKEIKEIRYGQAE